MSAARQPSDFQPTLWTIVLRAGDANDPRCRSALETLCRTYWKPVYVYLRRRGYAAADAEDATQALFAHLLDRGLLAGVRREGGKFRNFLITVLEHHLANAWRKDRAARRGGGRALLSFDFASAESEVSLDPTDGASPDPVAAFRRSWALAVFGRALETLRADFESRGASERFEVVRAFLSPAGERPGYADLAARLGTTETDVTNLIHRARRRFGRAIREELARTVDGPEAVEEEVRDLFASF